MVKVNERELICDDGFTTIWMIGGTALYAAHTPCGSDGQWTTYRDGQLRCLICDGVHPRWESFSVEEAINIHDPEWQIINWVAWFYNVYPSEVQVSIT